MRIMEHVTLTHYESDRFSQMVLDFTLVSVDRFH